MFTGHRPRASGRVAAVERRRRGRAARGSTRRATARARRGRRLGRGQRRLPDRRRRSTDGRARRSTSSRRRSRARRSAASRRRGGQPRAGAARRRAARRPLRPGPRRRRRPRRARVEPEGDGARVSDRGARRAPPLLRREGLDRGRRRLAHGRRARTTTAFAVALIPHTLARDDARRARAGRRGQPRGRRAREVRRAPASRPEATIRARSMDTDARRDRALRHRSRRRSRTSAHGKFVVVVDDADRENEGDLTIAAQFATPEAINFMATHGRGLICLCLTEERCDELGLRQMTEQQRDAASAPRSPSRSRRARASRPASRRRPRAHDPGRDRPDARGRTTSSSPATSSRCARAPGGVLAARGPDRGGRRPRAARRA